MPPKTKIPLEEVKKLYMQGLSGREIAQQINLPKSTVLQQIKNMGLSRPNMQNKNKTGQFCKKQNINDSLPNHFLGKTHTAETRYKISQRNKNKWTGDKNPNYGSHARKLLNHPFFKNGIGCYRGLVESTKPLVCEKCNSTSNIIIHHNDLNRTNNDISNLVVLCVGCHKALHALLKPRDRDPVTKRFLPKKI